ncbi:energy transducer TonB [Flavobacterium sp.]|uniref:energy transducer TonB n=1 Tax=Flavobacterium sp. TaxID=239 RepID=UPI0039E3D94E
MSKLSLYETNWINLVFEGKNKDYGAYQLRQENPRTTLLAFLFGLFFIASASGIILLLSSFGDAPAPAKTPDLPEIKITNVIYPPETPPLPPTRHTTTPPTEVVDSRDLINPIITPPEFADNDIRRNDDPPAAPDPGPTGTDTGTSTTTTSGTGTAVTLALPPDNGNTVITTVNVDVMPEFPGGVKKFLQYVGDNFEKPEIDETVTILMSFVIEKDGSMTDIKVLRNPGYGLDKEAIRVLKAQKTKWKPGIKNGQPVRVLYTLPIKVTRY